MIDRLAHTLRCSEGQVYTLGTGLFVTCVLAVAGAHAPRAQSLPSSSGPAVLSARTQPPVVIAPTPGMTSPPAPVQIDGPLTPTAFPIGGPTPDPEVTAFPSATPQPGSSLPARPVLFAKIGNPGPPGGVATAPDGRVYVPTNNPGTTGASRVLAFDGTGRQLAAIAVAGQPSGRSDGLGAIAVDRADGIVYAVDLSTSRVLRIDPDRGTAATGVTIPDLPPCIVPFNQGLCEPGAVDHAPALAGLAVSPAGDVYVADSGQGTVWRWKVTQKTASPWYQSMDFGSGDGPAGLVFAKPNQLTLSVGAALDPTNLDKGGVYSLVVNADGSAGARTLVASFAADDRPGALAVGGAGVLYTVLRGKGTIATVRAGTVGAFATSGSPVPLDGPSGLAVHGGRLLVSNQGSASRWVVVSFPLGR